MSNDKVLILVGGVVLVVFSVFLGLSTSAGDTKACGEACKGNVASVTWNKCTCAPVSP